MQAGQGHSWLQPAAIMCPTVSWDLGFAGGRSFLMAASDLGGLWVRLHICSLKRPPPGFSDKIPNLD